MASYLKLKIYNLILRLKKIALFLLPNKKEWLFVFKSFVVIGIITSFLGLFNYTSTKTKAASNVGAEQYNSVWHGFLAYPLRFMQGDAPFCNPNGKTEFANIVKTYSAVSSDDISCYELTNGKGQQQGPSLNQTQPSWAVVDYGLTGAVVNFSAKLISPDIVDPKQQILHYADVVKGTTYAASGTSGRETLVPVFVLNTVMRNIAYAVIIIIILINALSVLAANIFGKEVKITLFQLITNAGITILMITFFYEIAAIIFDLSVNWGNNIVLSIFEPFMNARVIGERLQPGGDLNITALLQPFQYQGLNQQVVGVFNNLLDGLNANIDQSTRLTLEAFPTQAIFQVFGFVGSIGLSTLVTAVSTFINNIISTKALFDTVFAWFYLLLNIKIFGNLFISFITFSLYAAFGPLMMLKGIGGGFDAVKGVFKTLFAFGLVFPMTFACILLAANVVNFFSYGSTSPDGQQNNAVANLRLCTYSMNDPVDAESGLVDTATNFNLSGQNQAISYRREKTTAQRIYNVYPAEYYNQDHDNNAATPNITTRDCRSKLFPYPWTYLPVPIGNYGNRIFQIQTVDVLIRILMAAAFLVIAMRSKKIIFEILDVEEMSAFKGLGGAFLAGVAPTLQFFGLGITGMGLSMGAVPFIGPGIAQALGQLGGQIERLGNTLTLRDVD